MRQGWRPKAVRHWAEKKIVLMELWYCATPFDIADHVYPHDPSMAERVQDNLVHWETHFPVRQDGPGPRFFRDLATLLGLEGETAGRQVIMCSLAEFIGLLPSAFEQRRFWERLDREARQGSLVLRSDASEMVKEALAPGSPLPPAEARDPTTSHATPALSALYHSMRVSRRNFLPSVREAVRSGRLDQKHFYLTPDATEGWFSLIRAESYPTYDHCKAGLRRLVASSEWAEAIAKVVPDTVVMLAGGGAPTKDLVLMHSLLKQPALMGRNIDYYLIDISPYMLCNAFWSLHEALAQIEGGDRIEVKPVQDDVLDLTDFKSELLRRDGNILFGITGGTFGNFSEDLFFRALNGVSRAGDLLIVSADTIPDAAVTATDVVQGRIVHKYDNADLRRFIGPAVRSLAAELDLVQPVGSVFDAVEIELDDRQRFSDVPNSLSLTMDMATQERRVNMLSSTRYRRPELRDFVHDRHWREIAEFESPFNCDYVQFLFERFE